MKKELEKQTNKQINYQNKKPLSWTKELEWEELCNLKNSQCLENLKSYKEQQILLRCYQKNLGMILKICQCSKREKVILPTKANSLVEENKRN